MDDDTHSVLQSLDAEKTEYHSAIGWLMLCWAQAEMSLYRVLLHYGGLSDAVGRAILSGSRAAEMMKYVNAIADNVGLPENRKTDLAQLFGQLAAINTMRNHIAHYGMTGFAFNTTKESVYAQNISNYQRASREENAVYHRVDKTTIASMSSDLEVIDRDLLGHLQGAGQDDFHPPPPRTWLYKSPQPTSAGGKSRKAIRTPSDPRPPSRK